MIPHLHGKFNTVCAANPPNLAVFPWLFYWLPCKKYLEKNSAAGNPQRNFCRLCQAASIGQKGGAEFVCRTCRIVGGGAIGLFAVQTLAVNPDIQRAAAAVIIIK